MSCYTDFLLMMHSVIGLVSPLSSCALTVDPGKGPRPCGQRRLYAAGDTVAQSTVGSHKASSGHGLLLWHS